MAVGLTGAYVLRPMTVRERESQEVQQAKFDHLQATLEGPERLPQQLQFNPEQASKTLGRLLREQEGRDEKGRLVLRAVDSESRTAFERQYGLQIEVRPLNLTRLFPHLMREKT